MCQYYSYIKYLKFDEAPKFKKIIKLLKKSIQSYGYYKPEDILLNYAWVDKLKQLKLEYLEQIDKKYNKDEIYDDDTSSDFPQSFV
jgi:hypothetical protein